MRAVVVPALAAIALVASTIAIPQGQPAAPAAAGQAAPAAAGQAGEAAGAAAKGVELGTIAGPGIAAPIGIAAATAAVAAAAARASSASSHAPTAHEKGKACDHNGKGRPKFCGP